MIKRFYLEITNACNLDCPFCDNAKGQSFMSWEAFDKYSDQIKEISPYVYFHVLGEPLMHPLFAEFMQAASAKNLKVTIVTNGSLLKKHPSILTYPALYKLAISIHSIKKPDREYRNIINNLIEDPRKAHLDLRFYDQLNDNQKDYLIELKERYGLKETKIKGQYLLTPNTSLNRQPFFKWPLIDDPFNSSYGTCKGIKEMLAILVDGRVTSCCLDPYGHNLLGDLNKESLHDIINSDQYKKVINDLNNNYLSLPLCQKCTYHQRFTKSS